MESALNEGNHEPRAPRFERLRAVSESVLATARAALREGNQRRLTVKNEAGHVLVDVPLSVGVIVALLAPAWTAAGVVMAMASGFSVIVDRPRTP